MLLISESAPRQHILLSVGPVADTMRYCLLKSCAEYLQVIRDCVCENISHTCVVTSNGRVLVRQAEQLSYPGTSSKHHYIQSPACSSSTNCSQHTAALLTGKHGQPDASGCGCLNGALVFRRKCKTYIACMLNHSIQVEWVAARQQRNL